MVQLDFAKHQVNLKLVFYGPALSGKTTNLEMLHKKAPADRKSKLLSVATKDDRTLFFDFMSLDLGKVGNMKTKFQLYTVPGQVYYNSTRRLVLMAVDGVVFVGDSQPDRWEDNIESYVNLEENLRAHNLDLATIPHVIQWNKRDLPDALDLEELASINKYNVPVFEAKAVLGDGVYETLRGLGKLVIDKFRQQFETYDKSKDGYKGPE